MRVKAFAPAVLMGLAMLLALAAGAASNGKDKDKDKADAAAATATHSAQDDSLEGEKKFHANCNRCHVAPLKFSPRMAATIVRHMRVRATLTDEEAHLILHYLAK